MTDSAKVRVFRWDGAMCVTDVIVGLAAPWWVTMYAAGLSFSLFASRRFSYWQNRKIELLTGGSNGTS